MSKVKNQPQESQTYQAMLSDLDEIVRNVGQGQLDLDEIVSKIEHGYKLISTMRTRLDATKSQVEKMRVDFEKGESTPSDHASQKKPSEKISKNTKVKEPHKNDDSDDDDGDGNMPF